MTTLTRILSACCLASIFALHSTPCLAAGTADPIVGKWQFFNNTKRTFREDGSSANGKGVQDATWKFAGMAGPFRRYQITYGGKFADSLVLKEGDNLLEGAKNFRTATRIQSAKPVVVAPPKPAPTPTPAAPATNGPRREMALANDWMPHRIMTAQEMLRSLAFYSLAAINGAASGQEAVPSTILWDLTWLMPMAEAEKKLPGMQRLQRDYRMQNPCFPQNSIFVKSFFGHFVDPNSHETFNEANLLFDAKQQLISVQLVQNHPKLVAVFWEERQAHWWTWESWMETPKDVENKDLPAMTGRRGMPGPDGRREPYYDFISLKNNASSTQQVWYQVRHAGTGVTSIHTLLVKPLGPWMAAEVIENVRWYLTAPFARKLLDIAKENKPASTPVR